MFLALAALLLVQEPLTKDDVIRLAREGAAEEAILAKVAKSRLKLSADDVVELKKAGVSERVIARLLETPRELRVANLSHKSVRISLRAGTIDIGFKEGQEIPPGGAREFEAAGEFALTFEGGSTTYRVKTPASLTFRGCDIAQVEVLTVQMEDPSGRRTGIVEARGKVLPGQEVPRYARYGAAPLEGLWRPSYSWLPFASDTVILGAGLGALIGHHYDETGKGALIGGGAGLLLNFLSSSPY